jgi:hypothetical protein
MMRGPIEIEILTGGKRPLDIRHTVLTLTTILISQGWYVPWTLTLIFNPINPQLTTLLISYEYLPEQIEEWHTLSIMEKLLHGLGIIAGENTEE